VVVIVFYAQVYVVGRAIVADDARTDAPWLTPLTGANLLLIGVDERPGHPEEGVRSDTLIVIHMSPLGRWASMLSIPRDTQIELPEVGTTKINWAYAQGYLTAPGSFAPETTPRQAGMARAAQAVEDVLQFKDQGLRIDYTAQINFDGFAAIIDALGGVSIDVPSQIIDEEYPTPDFGTIRVEFQPGSQRMDGQRALIYARTRHADSDFGRAERQQQVLRAIIQELRAKGTFGRIAALPGLLRAVQGSVTTTLPVARPDALLGLLLLAGGISPDELMQLRLSPDVVPVTETFGGNLLWDAAGVRAQVARLTQRPSLENEQALVQVLNGSGTDGLARKVSGQLESAGFRILVAADAPATPDNAPYPHTLVYDLHGKSVTARTVARTLQADVRSGPLPNGGASDADVVVILGADAAK
jgi:LCP family protein required for cell wall assembly